MVTLAAPFAAFTLVFAMVTGPYVKDGYWVFAPVTPVVLVVLTGSATLLLPLTAPSSWRPRATQLTRVLL